MKRISDVINRKLIVVNKETTFPEIIALMKEKKVGRLPVVENNKVIGVVTREDILTRKEKTPVQPVIAFWEILIALPNQGEFDKKLKKIAGYTADQVMTTEFYKTKLDDKLEDVITDMLELGHGYTLVFEEDKLLGIVTKTDLIAKCF
ncbi:MAG: CBS domain-containing protein [Fusobacteriaceae bacterium]